VKLTGAIVWFLLVGGLILGFGLRFYLKARYGPGGGPAQGLQAFEGVRQLDRETMSRLEALGIQFREATDKREPAVDLANPTEHDFQFLESVLRSNDPRARVAAAKVLRDIGSPRGIDPLVGAIRGMDDQDRFFLSCAFTLVNAAPADQRRVQLVRAWERHGEELSDEFKEAFRLKLRDTGALDPAWQEEAAVADPDPVVRRFALEQLLSRPGFPRGIVGVALADPDGKMRELAETALESRP